MVMDGGVAEGSAGPPAPEPPTALAGRRQLPAGPAQRPHASRHRVFHADFGRSSSEEKLGIDVEVGSGVLRVYSVAPGGCVGAWNSRCELTSPDDAIRPGDIIKHVNGQEEETAMKNQLSHALDFFFIVERKLPHTQTPEPLAGCCLWQEAPQPPPATASLQEADTPPPATDSLQEAPAGDSLAAGSPAAPAGDSQAAVALEHGNMESMAGGSAISAVAPSHSLVGLTNVAAA